MSKLTLVQIQQIVNDARANGLTPSEVQAVEEWLLHDSASGQLSTGEQTQLAIESMETDQRDEIQAGVIGLELFMDSYQSRARRRLSEVDWSDNE